jgi:hypothetical protein
VANACRAACLYHSLGYMDILVCHSQDCTLDPNDVPWARVVVVEGMDGCWLQAALLSHPTILFHTDHVVPSATTIRKLYTHWQEAPHCLHSLGGSRWVGGGFQPIERGALTTPCEVVDPQCLMLRRDALPTYLRMISDLQAYHTLGRRQFHEVSLSWALPPPHHAHPRLCKSLECRGAAEDMPKEGLEHAVVEDLIFDAWMHQCQQWAATHHTGQAQKQKSMLSSSTSPTLRWKAANSSPDPRKYA